MIESLQAIRSLGLAPLFERLYFADGVPADVTVYLRYPEVFRSHSLVQCEPLTEGGLVPLVGDGNGDTVCLFDPLGGGFVVKLVEEPRSVVRRFDSWQQYLAYLLLELADSGLSDQELLELARAVGFLRSDGLVAVLREAQSLPDQAVDARCERFIEECGP